MHASEVERTVLIKRQNAKTGFAKARPFAKMAPNTGSSSLGDVCQHFRGRRLLLQQVCEFARALPLRLKQPHVLDGDYRLVGEGLDGA